MKNVIFIGNFIVPDGNAAGTRVWNLGKLFSKVGYTPFFISFSEEGSTFTYHSKVVSEKLIYSCKYPTDFTQWFKIFKRFFLIKKIIENIGFDKNSIIYLYGSQSIYVINLLLLIYYKTKIFKVILDVHDYYTYNTNNLFFNLFKSITNFIQINLINRFFKNIVVISTFFLNKYKSKKRNIILIPPIFSPINYSFQNRKHEKLIVSYIGSPFRLKQVITSSKSVKDRVDIIIELFYQYFKNNESSKIELHFYGFTFSELSFAYPNLIHIQDCQSIKFFGKTNHNQIKNLYKLIDFTILFRDNNITSKAGFPTKISESITHGIPVIANVFGDIKFYIKNNFNGIIYDINDRKNNLPILLNKLSQKRIALLKERTLANNPFLISKYVKKFNKFIKLGL